SQKNDYAILRSVIKDLAQARSAFAADYTSREALINLFDQLGTQLALISERKEKEISTTAKKREVESEERRNAKRPRTSS
ncbi:hypothetical protein MPER_14716, partial [Moniliophthora perniciosa FA553]